MRYDLADLAQCGCESGATRRPAQAHSKSTNAPCLPALSLSRVRMDAESWDEDRIDRCCTRGFVRMGGSIPSAAYCSQFPGTRPAHRDLAVAPYSVLMLAGLVLGLVFWLRLRRGKDGATVGLYVAALAGAFPSRRQAGVSRLSRCWLSWGAHRINGGQWATGKSILGALAWRISRGRGREAPRGNPTVDKRLVCRPSFRSPLRWGPAGLPGAGLLPRPALQEFCLAGCPVEFLIQYPGGGDLLDAASAPNPDRPAFSPLVMAYGVFRFVHEPLRRTLKLAENWASIRCSVLVLAGLRVVGIPWSGEKAGHCPSQAFVKLPKAAHLA